MGKLLRFLIPRSLWRFAGISPDGKPEYAMHLSDYLTSRHTFASNLASAGVSLQVIARCLGHATTKMSERYARPDEASLRAVVAALDAEFKSSSKPALRTTQDDPG
jgi:hypothetical protein